MKNTIKYIKKIGLAILLPLLILTGCEDFLDQQPQDVVSEATYYDTPADFVKASNYFYTRLGFDYEGHESNEGDDSSDLSGNLSSLDVYGRGTSVTPTTDDIWKNNYIYLRAVNQLIEKGQIYTGDKKQIVVPVATAHFFRAWHHYLLLKRFGGVPIITRSLDVNSPELYGKRNSRYEVVTQIINDLNIAIEGLPAAASMGTATQGLLSKEAAKSLKARILLYEATWEKYVGEDTDGDGVTVGAGSNKPANYPSITTMLTNAKQASLEVMNSGAFELWDQRATMGERHLFYLFNLEDAGSNPARLTKANNKEFIFQTVFDFTLRKINQNLTHARPICPSRKLMDMYLCTDGLPVQYSSVFKGYAKMTDEFQNRDYRLRSFVSEPLKEYWGWGSSTNGGGAQYGVPFANSGINFDYRYVPVLTSPGGGRDVGYEGRKFTTEHKLRETRQESYNYPHIRLAEVMLIYAEATCELGNGSISDADLNISINKIRIRSGVAPLTQTLIAPYNDLNMLGEIRRERAIELDGENFRFDDLKRWGIAEAELNQNVCLNYIAGTEYETANNPKFPSQKIYTPGAFPYGLTTTVQSTSTYSGIAKTKPGALIFDIAGNRSFSKKNYVDPIPTNEIKINPNLVQNPGW
ncbi:RagB/SusD family nutrient uptake outer membrane protein [Flavobacterium fluviatile]|uniref:RagB/SusD family nutrient uptake outer membrane protein n=1 Tax=Flavobacterium fluviatile TaxID=1862387 RepID=UPI0013D3B0D7|nr:RagB/SusD family nutrient uptake outer membrane protein [Flavobacterium fluviatile]